MSTLEVLLGNHKSQRPTNIALQQQPEAIPLRPLGRSSTAHYAESSSSAGQFDLRRFAMKFSSSLKFNAVSEWWDEYIAYDALKKKIYELEKQQVGLRDSVYRDHDHDHDLEANESTSLMGPTQGRSQDYNTTLSSTDAQFIPLLDKELKKITIFYESQEKELMDDVAELQRLIQQQEDIGPDGHHQYTDDDDEDDDDEEEEDDDLFDVHQLNSPTMSREGTQRRRRRRSRSESTGGGAAPSDSVVRRTPALTRRRYSLSSTEDHGDLEASLVSLRSANNEQPSGLQLPAPLLAGPTSSIGRGESASRSPMRAAKQLASKIFMKDSVTSANFPVPTTIWNAKSNYAWDVQLLFKRRITNLYLTATSLRAYVELNYSGFRKILKKYDKVTESELKDRYLHDVVEQSTPFTQVTRDKLNNTISLLVSLYAKCVTHGDQALAKRQLRLHQREHIAWERDTVWRQMIRSARRGDGEGPRGIETLGGTLVIEEEKGFLDVQTPAGRVKITTKQIYLIISVIVFVVLLNVNVIEGQDGDAREEANKCFAVLTFATLLWATEAIPLFVTSIFVPLLLVVLRVIRSPDGETRLSTVDATGYIFSQMFSPTIMLLIGGFTIAAALSKTSIDRILITKVLSFAGTKPSTVLLAFMGVACFASMWISNVAAPTLCFTLIRPILRTLPPKSAFAPCLILGIALAANIGGQSSPISSPQNLIALQHMEPPLDWGKWFIVALPVSFISILLIWLLLLVSYRPAQSPDGEGEIEIRPIRGARDRFSLKQWWVAVVCLVTIALWCVEHRIERWVGDMGIIAIIPIVAFFSTGVLKKDDFEQFLWTVVFLAMGGIALGKGVTSSGLLDVMDDMIRDTIEGLSMYTVVMVLSVIVLVVSTFISHTIASVLLVPIAKEVGSKLPGNHQNLLIFLTGLICSTGMGMPVSGFPNQTAATQEDDMGQLYLSNVDFLKNGVPASIIAMLVVSTLGYVLMLAIGL
ncbi:Sodium/sulfate symporter [Panus rudis PR-1116 ss-1]|nr:Sodium/sulfate symporter [Panus rudis PR-1116 ss-1]